ncbi:MAG: cadmium-translocating P-type ATPase [Treponema sp.]|nr:cadmium-translocating P-type ATPase [Treponema sp.]
MLFIAALFFIIGILFEYVKIFPEDAIFFHATFSLSQLCASLCFFISYIVCGKNVVLSAIKNILKGNVFDEQFLMTIASLGAIFVGQYAEAVAVMLLYQIGEYAQDKALDKSRSSIEALMEICPDTAFVKKSDSLVEVKSEEVNIGDIIVVKPGQRIPIDGVVVKGKSFLNTSAITGESVPRQVLEGSSVFSGAINTDSVLEIETTKLATDSSASRIIKLVEEAEEKKARSEQFITRFSRLYTPIVCIVAVLIAIIPSVITKNFSTWIYRSLIFLVVSCPCALVISVPLSFFSGIGVASKNGILIKGSESIESLARIKTAVFDKTGTLTKGVFVVSDVHISPNANITEDELVALASHAETYSNHPISKSIQEAHSCENCNLVNITNAQEISGQGILVELNGDTILAGNEKLMSNYDVRGFSPCPKNDFGTVVHVAKNSDYCGHIVIADKTKEEVKDALKDLRNLNISKIVMLTGDNHTVASGLAESLDVDVFFADLLPEDKVKKIEDLLLELGSSAKHKRGTLFFAGDGINDSPVLARADVGISMGMLGSDAAIESSDVVIMNDEIASIADAIRISKKTVSIVKQNIAFSLLVKFTIMIFGALGFANMWVAVFGDTGVALLAVANALRTMFWKRK